METSIQMNLEVVNLQKELLKAALEKDGAFMDKNLHQEFIFTSPRAVVLNKKTFITNFVLNPDIRFEIFQLSDEKTVIIGHTAILYCLVQVKPVGQADFWEKVTFTSVQEDGRWLTLAMHATFIPA